MYSKAMVGAILSMGVSSLKVGVITDIHLHLRYNSLVSEDGECIDGWGYPTTINAPMGRYECDCPATLVETMFRRMKEAFGHQDVIFLAGDLPAHYTSMPVETRQNPKDTFSLLLDTFSGVNQMLAYFFPDTLILPVFGNNDTKFHDNPIPDEDRAFFYDYVYRLWF